MKQIQIDNFSQEEFIEFVYIAGLHKKANVLARAFKLEILFRAIQEKYEYKNSIGINFNIELDNELKKTKSLCSINELKLLRDIASSLPSGSNILEIGTYVGGTSLALLQGAKYSDSKYTSIDTYASFSDIQNRTNHTSQCMHWEHLEWQNNVSKYSELVTSYHGCSIPVLKDLIRQQKKYDLIFVDTAHELDSFAEFALIACLANNNCIFILDDVVDFNKEMTSAWLMSLKYNFSFPKFFNSTYALARPKNTHMPLNFNAGYADIFEKVSNITDLIERRTQDGCKISITNNACKETGFSLNFH